MEQLLLSLFLQYQEQLYLITNKTTYKTISKTSISQTVLTLKYKQHIITIKNSLGANSLVEINCNLPKKLNKDFQLKTQWPLFVWFNIYKNPICVTGDSPNFIEKINNIPSIKDIYHLIDSTTFTPFIKGCSKNEDYHLSTNFQLSPAQLHQILVPIMQLFLDLVDLYDIED